VKATDAQLRWVDRQGLAQTVSRRTLSKGTPQAEEGIMTTDLIHDKGQGPEIVGTRITIYHLLQSFLDPTVTEHEICRVYDLTARQVAAARAYVLGNPDTVLAEHLKIK
jgi:uncharacterized protein (DUF433 family)